jgi:hypothetical protein
VIAAGGWLLAAGNPLAQGFFDAAFDAADLGSVKLKLGEEC